jgi:hypothetical protein
MNIKKSVTNRSTQIATWKLQTESGHHDIHPQPVLMSAAAHFLEVPTSITKYGYIELHITTDKVDINGKSGKR